MEHEQYPQIAGLMKTTLLDFPGKVAATLFLQGCNFNCPYCHNAQLIPKEGEASSWPAIESFLRKRVSLLDGVCITGGEPLLQPKTKTLLKFLKELGYLVKLDTNGSFPDRLQEVLEEHLVDYVALDIKNSPENYAQAVGLASFDITPVKESLELLRKSAISYELRTTIAKGLHSREDFVKIGRWIGPEPHYFLQNFRDSEQVRTQKWTSFSAEELLEIRDLMREFVPSVALRGE